MTDQLDALARLRVPFDQRALEKLPRPFRKDAPKGLCATRARGGQAPDDQDFFCGKWHGLPAVHLDYVGHAGVTERLLEADPLWTWEPLAFGDDGLPLFVVSEGWPVGLWIKLTVCGITRIGFGSVKLETQDPEKQLIGDAIRNAAMRFGVALDLWKKSREDDEEKDAAPTRGEQQETRRAAPPGDAGGQSTHPALPTRDKEADRMAKEVEKVFGGGEPDKPKVMDLYKDARSRAGSPQPLMVRKIHGIPITLQETWDTIRATDLGGRGQWARHTWEALIESEGGVKYVDDYLIPKAEELYMNGGGKPLSWFYQKALIAWEELESRRDPGDATFDPAKWEAEDEAREAAKGSGD